MVSSWHKIQDKYAAAYFVWYESVPLIIHFLRGETWKQTQEGYFFRMGKKKMLDIENICIEFENNNSLT